MEEEYSRLITDSAIVINHLASLLGENNITTLIKDQAESGRLAGFGVPQNEVELHVLNSDYENAQKIIEQSTGGA
jgi:hypothetical protein